MLPIIGVPETIRQGLAPYRPLFCRDEGFEHVSRYVTGLILSPNKTLQGIYDLQVWGTDGKPSRRAMHEAVFEAGWDADALLPLHRQVVAPAHRGRGPCAEPPAKNSAIGSRCAFHSLCLFLGTGASREKTSSESASQLVKSSWLLLFLVPPHRRRLGCPATSAANSKNKSSAVGSPPTFDF